MSSNGTDPWRPPIAPPAPHVSPLVPTHDQVIILYVIVVYAVVIFGVWNIPGARFILTPLKLFTIGLHEMCHIIGAVLTGGTVLRVTIDPDLGGATIVEGGNPTIILSAGYVGSALLGAVFTLGGWDTLAAKIMSFAIGIGLIIPLVLVREKLTILLTLGWEALLIGFWFIRQGAGLRWYVLFIGVMNVLYVIWDIADDKYFRKINDSDATQFGLLYPRIPAHIWGLIWILFGVGVLVAFIIIGIVCFKLTNAQIQAQGQGFLPTP